MDASKNRSSFHLFKDARDYQILCLTLFLGLGVAMRDWSLQPAIVATAILTALITQGLLSWLTSHKELPLHLNKFIHGFPLARGTVREGSRHLTQTVTPPLPAPNFNWRSPLITALGLSLLLRTDHIATMAFAASIAIASKFLLKTNNKHFFNPANLGIIAALTLTNDAWVSPGQWGDEIWYAFIFIGAGGMVLKRVGRWDTTGMFLASYALLEAVRNLYLGWTWDVWTHRMMSGSLLLFALFMVTDPRSIPNARPARLIWALAIAVLTFVLRNQFYLPTAVFWALFLLAPLTIVLDKLWESPRFEWKQFRKPQLSSAN
ncbi:MAG: Na+-transporting NADH:ubiquinone oxidoreductase, subunit NqrB [Leptolyngbya sp. SIO3F4]|nr:Na+-transporting NADH:ubiquinone oxidoreductase, subunit NqrB [Leptolyngbya sp. SIO3F4]